MRSELKFKFLRHVYSKKTDWGFTLVELLVVIVIIGILTAIALPNFLSQSGKAKQAEAKQNISAINRAQSYLRADSTSFASTFDQLAIGTLSGTGVYSTLYYTYSMTGTTDTATAGATARDSILKSYSAASLRFNNAQNSSTIATAICENVDPGITAAASVIIGPNNLACAATTTALK